MAKLKDSRVYGNLDIDSVLTVSSDTTINGNLTVTGNTIYSYVDTMKITDPILEMGGAESGALTSDDNKDRGSLLHYYDGAVIDAFMGWDNSAGEFALGSNVSVTNEVVTFNEYGNLRAGTFYGNGAGLTNIPGGNVDGTVGYANMSSYAGIVTGATQSNITTVGTLTNVSTSGNITASGNLSVTGTSTLTGDVELGGNATIDGSLTVSGTIYANISGNLTAPGTNSQVLFNDDGAVNAVSGFTFNKSTHSLSITGDISGDTISGNLFSGDGGELSNIAGANVTGYVPDADHATIANIANVAYSVDGSNVSGEVATANTVSNPTQGNITTVGTLTVLNVEGDIWGNSNISIEGSSTVGGDLDVTGDISGANGSFSGTLSVTGNATTGNLSTGIVAASGNVTGSNLNTAGTANIGNLEISGKTKGHLIPDANVTYDLGNASHRWNDLYLSGNTIYLGDQTIEANATSLFTSADIAAGNLRASNNTYSGNVYANSGLVKGAHLEGVIETAAQPNITSVGTLVDLTVTGNAAVGGIKTDNYYYANGTPVDFQQAAGSNTQIQFNLNGDFGADSTLTFNTASKTLGVGNVTATGNISSGNLSTDGDLAVSGDATITGSLTAGSITTSGSSGNISGANVISANTVTATVEVSSPLVTTTDVTATSGDISINAAGSDGNVTLVPTGTGTVDVSNKRITSLASPSASTDAVNKAYVDSVAQGLHVKSSVHVATAQPLQDAYTYDNGTAGVGATLTADNNGTFSDIDSHGVAVGDRILIKNETGSNAPYNGVYTVTDLGSVSTPWVLTRATDMDVASEFEGAFIFVSDGTINGTTGWAFSVPYENFNTIGTDNVEFTQFSGAGTYSVDGGLLLDGTQLSLVLNEDQLEIASGALAIKSGALLDAPNIGAATGTSLDLTGGITLDGDVVANGNVTANNFNGTFNGTFTGTVDATVGAAGSNTEIQFNDAGNIAANAQFTYNKVTDTLSVGSISVGSDITVTGNVDAGTISGTITTASQTNITSVGTLGFLAVTGNVDAGNVNASSGTINGAYLKGDGYQIGNIAGANVTGQVANAGWSDNATNAQYAYAVNGANVSGDVSGANHANIADVAYSVDGGNVNGTVSDATNAQFVTDSNQSNITQVGTLVSLDVTGNVAAGGIKTDNYYYANGTPVDFQTAAGNAGEIQFKSSSGNDLSASANFKFNGSTNVLTVTGNVSVSDTLSAVDITATTLTGTLTTAAQPNITSVGEMTGLTVRGISDFGSNSNVVITGGTSGQYLQTDGLGSLSWATVNTTTIANGTSNVSVALNGNITLNVASDEIIKVSGTGANVTGILDVSGNINAANINTGLLVADSNVDSTSSITGTVKVTGGIGATGNIYTGQSVGFANNNGGTASAAYIQFNASANSLDFIFN